jgi:hypothetical protein
VTCSVGGPCRRCQCINQTFCGIGGGKADVAADATVEPEAAAAGR